MVHYCKFHPLEYATRTCSSCDINVCDPCSDESPLRRSRGAQHACFICNTALQALERAESGVEPFWRRLSAIYQYPLSIAAAAVILITSFLSALLANMGWFQLAPSIMIMLYCFACLRETAAGNLKAPGVEACFDGSIRPLINMILIVIFAIGVSFISYRLFGTGLSILVATFFVITLPAAILVIAIDGDLIPALDPAKLIAVVVATGTSYFVMLLFLLIMISSVALLASYFHESRQSFSGVLIQSMISNYYSIVEFHILGYLVFQNRFRLGFESTGGHSDSDVREHDDWLNAKLELLVKAGEYAAAADLAKQQVALPKAELWKWTRCFNLYCAGTKFAGLKAFVPSYFDKLASLEQHDTLADAYMVTKKRLRDYRIEDNVRCLQVARDCFDIGRHAYVVDLLQDFHQRLGANPAQVDDALDMLIESCAKIPGMEKKAQLYQRIVQLRNAAV